MQRNKSGANGATGRKRPAKAAVPANRRPDAEPGESNAARSALRLIVGIGASAGGLQAFKTFFANMPAGSGMAFVLVQHLDPQHRSMLVELLTAGTAMQVVEAEDRTPVVADHVYVIPPNATLGIADGKLRVSKPAPAREHRRPVDTFFSTLAEDQKENAVCIILSGGGSDGTEGLRAIKEHGGLTMAQADFDEHAMSGMPMSAAATGLVDYVLAIEAMPAKLIAYSKHLLVVEPSKGPDGTREDTAEHLGKICALLRGAVGHDFRQYKEKTLIRRIQRRMQVLQLDTTPAYIERLRKEPGEMDLLFRELLIGVTHFFRDPPAFDALATQVIPHLIHDKDADDTVRVWVPACATGEEVYSIAILLKEAVGRLDAGTGPRFQIFATDIDDQAIAIARAARYRKSQIADISDARIERWFAQDGDHWCPVKEIREMCIFSAQSVIKDPPFSRLDLISCRNLMIYLDTGLQDRLIRTFHYALRPGGYLFLGTSENVTRQSNLFATTDQKHRIFQRRDTPAFLPALASAGGARAAAQPDSRSAALSENGIEGSARRLMEKHLPPYVVVDRNHDVLRFSGQTDKYLGPAPGVASLNLFSLIRRGLRSAARAALAKALTSQRPVTHEALAIEVNGARHLVDLAVEPLVDSEAGLCVVTFLDRRTEAAMEGSTEAEAALPVEALERELLSTRQRLEATVDQLETSNEEMKSANEEYQSVNEELQSTNEELETSKEEMQSINEELQTVNAELNSKNDALLHLNSDLKNLLDSTQIATLFLDRHLRIRSFTPPMTDLFHVRESDHGRPVTEIVSRLSYDGLRQDATRVMRDLSVVERELNVRSIGLSFLMRMRPYRRADDVIDGVVITFVDISERTRHEEALREGEERYRALFDLVPVAVYSCDASGVIQEFNRHAVTLWGREPERGDTDEKFCGSFKLFRPDGSLMPHDRCPMADVISGRISETCDAEVLIERPDGSRITVIVNIRPLKNDRGEVTGAINCFYDITERKQTDDRKALMMDELNHRVKNTLATVQSIAVQSLKSVSDDQSLQNFATRLVALSRTHDLLARENWESVSLRDLLLQELKPYRSEEGAGFVVEGPDLKLDPKATLALGLAIHELTTNAAKYGALSKPGGQVRATWDIVKHSEAGVLRLKWVETGGPPVKKPERKGFGWTVIQRGLSLELDGEVQIDFNPSGLACTIDIPLPAGGGGGSD